jgi:hypothetical protein
LGPQEAKNSSPSITSYDGKKADVIGSRVAFSPRAEEWMTAKLYSGVGSLYLVGVVSRQKKKGNGRPIPDQFEIRWTVSQFQSSAHIHYVSLAKVKEGISNYNQMNGTTMVKESWDALCKSFEACTTMEGDLWDQFEEVEDAYVRYETSHHIPVDLGEVERMKAMEFQPEAKLTAPSDLYTHDSGGCETRLKEEWKHLFRHSASSSFFAFLPLSFWRQVVDSTNSYADSNKQPKFNLEEIMTFLGILFFMSLVDKGEYTN